MAVFLSESLHVLACPSKSQAGGRDPAIYVLIKHFLAVFLSLLCILSFFVAINPRDQRNLRLKKSIKSAGSCRQKSKNLKFFYLLFSHRVTRSRNRESTTIFDSNAHVRPIIEARTFSYQQIHAKNHHLARKARF